MRTTSWKTGVSLLWVLVTIVMMGQILLSWSVPGFQRTFWFRDPARRMGTEIRRVDGGRDLPVDPI